MKTSSAEKKCRPSGKASFFRILSLCLLALVAAFLVYRGARALSLSIEEKRAVSLKNAVISAAFECYAVEGVYPRSLSYLEEHYGLIINHNRYIVSYDCCAPNRVPDVMVLAR